MILEPYSDDEPALTRTRHVRRHARAHEVQRADDVGARSCGRRRSATSRRRGRRGERPSPAARAGRAPSTASTSARSASCSATSRADVRRAATDRVPGGRGRCTSCPSASSRRTRLAPTNPVAPVTARARTLRRSSGSRRRRGTARRAAGSRRAPPATGSRPRAGSASGVGVADRAPRDRPPSSDLPFQLGCSSDSAALDADRVADGPERARADRAITSSARTMCRRPGKRSRHEQREVLVQRPAEQVAARATAGPAALLGVGIRRPRIAHDVQDVRASAGRRGSCRRVDDDDRAVADVDPLACRSRR